MKILVLGGDGFLGSHFVERALGLGHEVAVFDRFPYGRSRHLAAVEDHVRLLSGEFGNRDALAAAVRGQEVVYHFISATNPQTSWRDPMIEIEENIAPSLRLMEIAAEAGVRKLVFPSSGGTVYGRASGVLTESTPAQPFSPYGIGKLAVELFLQYYATRTGMAVDIYRIANAYGPRQPVSGGQGVMAVWMKDILEGRPVQVYGDHTVVRDYVYVGDVAHLMGHSLAHVEESGTFNVGTGRPVSIVELLSHMQRVVGAEFPCVLHPRRPSDNLSVVLDSSRLLSHFPGFQFQSLAEKLPETWTDFRRRFPRRSPLDAP